jgi:hypothetical protein
MRFRTIKNSGKVGMEFCHTDSNGARVTRDLLRRLIINIVKKSTKYYDETGDHVFAYREKQLHSVICPSIEMITPSFLIEHPLTRKPAGEEEYTGYADYWISYRNYSFLLELKHSYFAYKRAKNPRQSIGSKFDNAIQQLKNVRKSECQLLTENNGLIKIALEAIVFYEGSSNEISNDVMKDQDFPLLLRQLISNSSLKDRVNFSSIWVLNKRLVEPYEYSNSFERYPALGFIGHISEMP